MEKLEHSGIKGMKWGVRRFQNKDGSLTPAGKKRYTDGEKNSSGDNTSQRTNADRESRVKRLIDKCKQKVTKEKAARAVVKGAEVTGKLLVASAADDVFYGGAGKRILKETIKQTGRAAVTAYVMANGGYDIRWYDR